MSFITFNSVTKEIYNISEAGIKNDNPALENVAEIFIDRNLPDIDDYSFFRVREDLNGIYRLSREEIATIRQARATEESDQAVSFASIPSAIRVHLFQIYKEIDALTVAAGRTAKTLSERQSELRDEINKLTD